MEVNDEAAAYTIFEVLNDRGLELSVSDLLKNFIFRVADDRVNEVQQHWTTMVGILEGSGAEEKDLRTFIRHVWASRHGLTREKELYDRIRSSVTSKQRAVDLAENLSQQAKIYAGLEGPTVRDSVDALLLLKATQIRPLVLAVLKQFKEKEVRRALPMLVCWTVRFLIVGKVGSGPLESGYSERAKEVSNGAIETATALYEASKNYLAGDDEFEQAFRTARVSAHYLARFYLRILEHSASFPKSKELVVNPSEIAVTLEHIMPQTQEPHWGHITEDQHKSYVNRLGNLALLDKNLNEKAGNLSFSEKAETFAKSKIELTRRISAVPGWDLKVIEARQG